MSRLSKVFSWTALLLGVLLLNGCAVALVGGAAGGYYVGHNYNIQKKASS